MNAKIRLNTHLEPTGHAGSHLCLPLRRLLQVTIASAVLLLGACSDNGTELDAGAAREPSSDQPLFDDSGTDPKDKLRQDLLTGASGEDRIAYWNCAIDSANPVSNLHVRFWSDGSGFSGTQPTTWEVLSGTTVKMDYASSGFTLSNVEVSKTDSLITMLANDSDGSSVSCNRVGPLLNPFADDPGDNSPQAKLRTFLHRDSTGNWTCVYSDNRTSSLIFTPGNELDRDGEVGTWLVTNQFNVIMEAAGKREVWESILPVETNGGQESLTAEQRDSSVTCTLNQ